MEKRTYKEFTNKYHYEIRKTFLNDNLKDNYEGKE